MKDRILYVGEGLIIGFFGTHFWNDVLLPMIVAALCAVVTLLIQFFGKRFLNSLYDRKLPKWKQNGRK